MLKTLSKMLKSLNQDIKSLNQDIECSKQIIDKLKEIAYLKNNNLLNNNWNNWEKFQINLQRQYNEVQERSSGVYKRKAKVGSFVTGLVIAFIANADTFNIVNNLNKNNQDYTNKLVSKLEESTVISTRGDSAGKELTPAQREIISTIVKDNQVGILPLGWDYDLELDKQKQVVDNTNKEALITILDRHKEKIELLGNNQEDCQDDKVNQCYEILFNDIKSNKGVVHYLGKEFTETYKKDSKGFYEAYKKLLKELKEEQESKIFSLNKDISISNQSTNDWRIPDINSNVNKQGGWPRVLFGWFISAIAISMGAPFWFDLLGNVMNVRNSGKDFRKNRN